MESAGYFSPVDTLLNKDLDLDTGIERSLAADAFAPATPSTYTDLALSCA